MVNYRSTDRKVYGIVSPKYQIVQNREAFSFTDSLIGNGVSYEAAGYLREGRTVWIMARMPNMDVLGDEFESYMLFTNSHDGSSGVRCCMTNIRIVCQNMLNMIMSGAVRSWSFYHRGDIAEKIAEARRTLEYAAIYNQRFGEQAEILAKKKISALQAKKILDKLFPVEDDMGEVKLNNLVLLRQNFQKCYDADDIANFKGTAWGMLNAFSDMFYHGGATLRKTENYEERKMVYAINGHAMFNKAHELLMSA
jgi:phage/plasmid-like protein (TIGR03299 family)